MPIEPHRIEAAARAMLAAHDWTEGGAYSGGWETMPADWQEAYRVMAAAAIAAAHPELAAGTAWVAPAKPDMAMLEASLIAMVGEIDARYPALPEDKPDNAFMRGLIVGAGSGRNSEEMRVAYEAARDAHLSKGKDDDHG